MICFSLLIIRYLFSIYYYSYFVDFFVLLFFLLYFIGLDLGVLWLEDGSWRLEISGWRLAVPPTRAGFPDFGPDPDIFYQTGPDLVRNFVNSPNF